MSIEAIRDISRAIAKPRVVIFHPGWLTLIATVGLVALGLHAISIAGGTPGALAGHTQRQLMFTAIGLFAAAAVCLAHYRLFEFLSWALGALLVASLIFLLLPFVPASIVSPRNGARGWINLGFTDIQPAEFGKVIYALVLAAYLSSRSSYRTVGGLLIPCLLTGVPTLLVLFQPDLGTATLYVPVLVAVLIAAGAKLKHLLGACALGGLFAAGVVAASLFFAQRDEYPLLRKYQVERLQALADRASGETAALSGRGFQGQQAVMIAGAGGLTGHDPDRSSVLVKFSGLPERHNDMIFAVVVNRFGLLGALATIALYVLWCAGALLTAASCKDPFGRLVCVALAATVSVQAIINMGMNIGILPITGITLPFVSYGGSSLLAGFLMTGLVFNIAMRRPDYLWRESFEFGPRRG